MHRSSVTDLSVRPYLLVHRLCIARLPVPLPLVCLLCRCPVVGLPLICHACIARLSPRLSAGLPLSCRWYIAALSARVVVAALSAALPLVLPLLCLFVRRWSLTDPSLVCLLVSLCSVTDPSLTCLLGSWSLTCLLVSCRCSAALLLHSAAPLDCSTPLGCSTPLHSAARLHSTRLLYYSTRLALRAFLFYLLVEFGRHAVHTHSVPRVVSRHSVITHSLFHGCSHCRCLLSSSA